MEVTDILLDDKYDLLIENGDFTVSFSDKQHVDLILQTYLGDWKQFPLVGLGIDSYMSSPNTDEVLRRDITVQLKADGYQVLSVEFTNDGPDNLHVFPQVVRIKK